jgi:hypothetical protein
VSSIVSRGRRAPAPLGVVLAAVISFWVCFGLVAATTRSASRPEITPQLRRAATHARAHVGLHQLSALRVRAAVLRGAATIAPAPPATTATAPAPPATTAPQPAPATTAPQPAPATTAPQPAPATTAPQPQPVVQPRPQPKPSGARKRPPAAFDDVGSNPSSFDSSG